MNLQQGASQCATASDKVNTFIQVVLSWKVLSCCPKPPRLSIESFLVTLRTEDAQEQRSECSRLFSGEKKKESLLGKPAAVAHSSRCTWKDFFGTL